MHPSPLHLTVTTHTASLSPPRHLLLPRDVLCFLAGRSWQPLQFSWGFRVCPAEQCPLPGSAPRPVLTFTPCNSHQNPAAVSSRVRIFPLLTSFHSWLHLFLWPENPAELRDEQQCFPAARDEPVRRCRCSLCTHHSGFEWENPPGSTVLSAGCLEGWRSRGDASGGPRLPHGHVQPGWGLPGAEPHVPVSISGGQPTCS